MSQHHGKNNDEMTAEVAEFLGGQMVPFCKKHSDQNAVELPTAKKSETMSRILRLGYYVSMTGKSESLVKADANDVQKMYAESSWYVIGTPTKKWWLLRFKNVL